MSKEDEVVENMKDDLMNKLDLYKSVLVRGFVTEYNEHLSHVTIHFGKPSHNPYIKRIEFEKDDLKNIVEGVDDFVKENAFEEIVRDAENGSIYVYEELIEQFEIFFHDEYFSSLKEACNTWGRTEVFDMIKDKNQFLIKFIIKNMRKKMSEAQ